MMQFAAQFPDFEKVSTLWTQLSWSHIRELLPLKTIEEKLYYAEEVNKGFLGVRDLRHLIARKAFLRRNNANLQLTRQSKVPFIELYLNWLNQYDRREGEEAPIGLILCTDANRKVAELMELDKSGIAVAEYWTKLPPKEQFESKIQEIMAEAKERIERRKLLGNSNVQKQINYFLEESSDETDDND
jgi:hypothetical protein